MEKHLFPLVCGKNLIVSHSGRKNTKFGDDKISTSSFSKGKETTKSLPSFSEGK